MQIIGRMLQEMADAHSLARALQGFPADYIWKGTESSIAQMIANAMPAELAGAIAGSIMNGGTIQERIL